MGPLAEAGRRDVEPKRCSVCPLARETAGPPVLRLPNGWPLRRGRAAPVGRSGLLDSTLQRATESRRDVQCLRLARHEPSQPTTPRAPTAPCRPPVLRPPSPVCRPPSPVRLSRARARARSRSDPPRLIASHATSPLRDGRDGSSTVSRDRSRIGDGVRRSRGRLPCCGVPGASRGGGGEDIACANRCHAHEDVSRWRAEIRSAHAHAHERRARGRETGDEGGETGDEEGQKHDEG